MRRVMLSGLFAMGVLVSARGDATPGANVSDDVPVAGRDVCEQTSKPAGVLTVTVDGIQGTSFGVLAVFVDYPEDLVFIPGEADDPEVQAAVTDRPTAGSPQCLVNDRDHGVQVACLSVPGFPGGQFFRVSFRDCAKGGPPTLQRFTCKVVEAADAQGAELGATCALSLS